MRAKALCVVVFVALAALAYVERAPAATTLPSGFSDSVVESGLTYPTAFAFTSGGRLFVAEQRGVIKTFDSISDPTPTVVIDVRTQVLNNEDRGLLGLVVDPQFPTRPYLYIQYTYDAPPNGTAPVYGTPGTDSDICPAICVAQDRVSRITLGSDFRAVLNTVLTKNVCSARGTHAGGGITVGRDGSLYVTFGESAGAATPDYGQAQDNQCGDPPTPAGVPSTPPDAEGGSLRSQDILTSADPAGLSGSLIRIDPDTGAGWPGNPYASSADVEKRKIVAHGFRNPFRIAQRPGSDEVYVGDVGWKSWEEIDLVADSGAPVENFGWPCFEGPAHQPSWDALDLDMCEDLYAVSNSTKSPYFTYSQDRETVPGDGCSVAGGGAITGLAFYSGTSYPSAYRGGLFFQDFERHCVWFMAKDAAGRPNPATARLFARGLTGVDIHTGPGGDVYMLDVRSGELHRFHYNGSNTLPVANIVATPSSGVPPLNVTLDGRGSADSDPGATLRYAWDVDNDGAFDDGTAATRQVTFSTRGSKTVRLRVTDNHGATNVASAVVTVGRPPVPTIDTPSATTKWRSGQTISFSGHATDPEDGPLPGSRLSWVVTLHHCSTPTDCHQHHLEDFAGASGSFVAPDHEYLAKLELQLIATDSDGVRAVASRTIDAQVVDLTITSSPSGLTMAVGSTTARTPFTVPLIVGSSAVLTAVSPQVLNGVNYAFGSWSHGGPATQQIVVPATDRTYSATFTNAGRYPVAAAGPDFGVPSSTDFVLDGTGSSDPDGDPLTYRWLQVKGPEVALLGKQSSKAIVRGIKGPATLTFRLSVTDSRGLASTDTVVVTVRRPK
jgi:glucose/arabinose dehydrogenase